MGERPAARRPGTQNLYRADDRILRPTLYARVKRQRPPPGSGTLQTALCPPRKSVILSWNRTGLLTFVLEAAALRPEALSLSNFGSMPALRDNEAGAVWKPKLRFSAA
jgi:hypothetical protein